MHSTASVFRVEVLESYSKRNVFAVTSWDLNSLIVDLFVSNIWEDVAYTRDGQAT